MVMHSHVPCSFHTICAHVHDLYMTPLASGEEEHLDGARAKNCLAPVLIPAEYHNRKALSSMLCLQIRDASLGGLHAVSRNNFPTAAGLASRFIIEPCSSI
jgi:hypothetical protein